MHVKSEFEPCSLVTTMNKFVELTKYRSKNAIYIFNIMIITYSTEILIKYDKHLNEGSKPLPIISKMRENT